MGLDTSHDAWHGSYSTFNEWRNLIARAAGFPPLKEMVGFGGERSLGDHLRRQTSCAVVAPPRLRRRDIARGLRADRPGAGGAGAPAAGLHRGGRTIH